MCPGKGVSGMLRGKEAETPEKGTRHTKLGKQETGACRPGNGSRGALRGAGWCQGLPLEQQLGVMDV